MIINQLSNEEKEILAGLIGKRVAILDHRGYQTANAIYKGVVDGFHVFKGSLGTWDASLSDAQISACKIVLIKDQESEKLWMGFEANEPKKWAFEGRNS